MAHNRSTQAEARRVPVVGRPVDQRHEKKEKPPVAMLGDQTVAEFAPLIVGEQQVGGGGCQDDRPPHCAENLKKIRRFRNELEQENAEPDEAGPNADAKKPAAPGPRVRKPSDPGLRPRVKQTCSGPSKPRPRTSRIHMKLQKNGLPRRCNCSLSMLSLPRCDVPSRLRLRRDCLPTAAKLSPDGRPR